MSGPWDKYQQQPAPDTAGPWAKYQAPAQMEPEAEQPDILERAHQSLREVGHDPNSGFLKKAGAVAAALPVSLAQSVQRAVSDSGAAARNELTPDGMVQGGANMGQLIATGRGMGRAAGALASDAAETAGRVRMAPKQAPAPTRAAVRQASEVAYKEAENAGVVIAPKPFAEFVATTEADLLADGLNRTLHPNVMAALRDMKTAVKGGQPQTLKQIETLRRVANKARQAAANDTQAAEAGKLVRKLDEFMDNLDAQHLEAGDASIAVPALQNARGLWRKNAKMGEIEDIVTVAERQDDPSAYIKAQFRKINKDQDQFSRFSKEEQALIQEIATTGKLEAIGKVTPDMDTASGIAKGVAHGAAALGTGGASLAIPMLGYAAKRGAISSRKASVQQLMDLIARREPEKGMLERVQMTPRPQQIPGRQQQMLGRSAPVLSLAAPALTGQRQ